MKTYWQMVDFDGLSKLNCKISPFLAEFFKEKGELFYAPNHCQGRHP